MTFFPPHSGPARARSIQAFCSRSAAGSRLLLLLLSLVFLFPTSSLAQTAGDFRSRQSGDWGRSNTWEEFDGSVWTNSNNTPDATSGVVIVQSGHVVNGNSRGDYDQVVIEAGAELSIARTFTVLDGPGTDLDVYGRLVVGSTTTLQGNASAFFHPGSETLVSNRTRLFFQDTVQATWANGSILNVDGTLQVADSAVLTLSDNTVFTNAATIKIIGNGVLSLENSTFINQGSITLSQSGSLIVGSGSVYEHDQDGGSFPAPANTTWTSGSTALVSGVISSAPGNLATTFSTFVWDSPSQTGDADLLGDIVAISDAFIINDTGTGRLVWDGRSNATLPVNGDFQLNGGEFVVTDSRTSAITVSGDATIAAGTTLTLADNGSGTFSVAGSFTYDGGLTTLNGGLGTLELNGSTTQSLAVNGSMTGDINVLLSGTGSTSVTTDLIVPGSVTETSGGLDMGGNALSVENDLIIATSLTNVASLTFTGIEPSILSLPAGSQTISELIVDKAGSSLTLASDLTVTGNVIMTGSTFDEAGFTLTLAEGATFYSDQPTTGTVTISRTFSQSSDGWRMIASPVQGVSYSNLNGTFFTQGAPWAEVTFGTANLHAFDSASQGWTPINGADGPFANGSGYILYAFAQDDAGVNRLPTTWTVTGIPGALASQTLPWNGTPETSWDLVGNPSTANLDWDLTVASSSFVGSSYATWDPSGTDGGGMTGYKYYDAASGIGSAGRYIAPFTAFMVQATATGASMQPASSPEAATQTAQQFGKTGSIAPHFRLSVEGESLAEPETILSFGAEATDASSAFDVSRLVPLSTQYATMWSADGDRRLAFDGRTMEDGREIYDLVFATTRPGQYTIAVEDVFDIPDSWTARMVDLSTGNELILESGQSLTFQTRKSDLVTADSRFSSDRSARFRVIVEDPNRISDNQEDWSDTSAQPVLSQNYPNPFNPVTTIRFSLPESAPVRLEVFDMIGRRVATLADGVLAAGWHEANFNAGTLSSGMYLYRLSVAGQIDTRSMLLLR